MTRRRKTRTRQEWEEADLRAWDEFSRRLEAAESMGDALALYASTPPPDSPGRRYYSNLGFFLQSFDVPGGSDYDERAMYLRFVKKLDDSGALKPGAGRKVRDKLRRSMEA
ncbi:hypothetical protein GBA63_19785 [Rubrobacter tropicus]|uniref:Uncharacterized protein n=1 Tax=Rubrobacter tropicus TaxID=2653851 RepID=A0A6G8QDX1_9ACTN|nr:hypothetical protein [Rubrobacter tropicus]QIN84642.1 hypothetical protein GBA63_19785 [Rubrobacter tropicus]